ncbi:MAG: hypothetical protein N2C14_19065 [Planctomycetales bacterium]
MTNLPVKDELEHLPFRSVVAYAARCAHRVQPLNAQWVQDANSLGMVLWAIGVAEKFARDRPVLPEEYDGEMEADVGRAALVADHESAYAAVYALRATVYAVLACNEEAAPYAAEAVASFAGLAAEGSGYGAAQAAKSSPDDEDAYAAAHAAITQFARDDFEKLRALNLGEPRTMGESIDPSEQGPLGSLWPDGEPAWHAQESENLERMTQRSEA